MSAVWINCAKTPRVKKCQTGRTWSHGHLGNQDWREPNCRRFLHLEMQSEIRFLPEQFFFILFYFCLHLKLFLAVLSRHFKSLLGWEWEWDIFLKHKKKQSWYTQPADILALRLWWIFCLKTRALRDHTKCTMIAVMPTDWISPLLPNKMPETNKKRRRNLTSAFFNVSEKEKYCP